MNRFSTTQQITLIAQGEGFVMGMVAGYGWVSSPECAAHLSHDLKLNPLLMTGVLSMC